MKLTRLAFLGLALALGLAARTAPAQSIQQPLLFSINAEYEYTTNATPNSETVTDDISVHHNLLVTTHGVVKAIAVDLFGRAWTNWISATLLRRVNPVDGTEGIFLRNGTKFTNVSSFFGDSFQNDFTEDVSNSFPGLTNNFTPQLPVFHGSVSNGPAGSFTNTISLGNVRFISLNTTNLKFNLIGVNLSTASNGRVTNVVGTVDQVRYSAQVDTLSVSVVGSLYINTATNLFDGAPFQPYSGPARGAFSTGQALFSIYPGPPGP
jgi:hypothetical protein